ncbi:MAG: glycosyltransferase [Sedimentisphaerales bacterium]
MLVSVIIPTYNRSKYVTKAIESVLAQTYKSYEIILIDDGSSDDTKELIKPYLDRVKYFYQDNSGASAARNNGIRNAKGQWIAFLDSDDEWLPDKLAVQTRFIEKHSEIVAHMVNINLVNYNGKSLNSFLHCKFPHENEEGLIKEPFIPHLRYRTLAMPSGVMCRRECAINAGLFDESFCIGEDYDFMCRLALQGSWGYCSFELVRMYHRTESTMRLSSFKNDYSTMIGNLIKTHKKLLQCELTETERKHVIRVLARNYNSLGYASLCHGNESEAGKAYEQAYRIRPEWKSNIGRNLAVSPNRLIKYILLGWGHLIRIKKRTQKLFCRA